MKKKKRCKCRDQTTFCEHPILCLRTEDYAKYPLKLTKFARVMAVLIQIQGKVGLWEGVGEREREREREKERL